MCKNGLRIQGIDFFFFSEKIKLTESTRNLGRKTRVWLIYYQVCKCIISRIELSVATFKTDTMHESAEFLNSTPFYHLGSSQVKVVNWSSHILNRSPALAVQNMTPEETWSGYRPRDKGAKCIFCLCISEQSKAYKLYDPITKKILSFVLSVKSIFFLCFVWNPKSTKEKKIVKK